jgi:hypothetical protein
MSGKLHSRVFFADQNQKENLMIHEVSHMGHVTNAYRILIEKT